MGGGSTVAKEAAHLVLTDNNFSSILVGIKHGRLVFNNLAKVLYYLFPAGSWSEITPVIANVFFGVPLPLSSFLMIYICCITDVGPALALIKEKPESDVMSRKPRKKGVHFIDGWTFLRVYAYLGMLETIGAFTMFFWYMYSYHELTIASLFFSFENYGEGFPVNEYRNLTATEASEALFTGQTVFFVALVIMQFGNLLSTRTQFLSFFQFNPFYGPGQNLYLFLAILVSLTLSIIVIYVPFINIWVGTRPIPAEFWFAPLLFSLLIFCCEELRKFIVRSLFYMNHENNFDE